MNEKNVFHLNICVVKQRTALLICGLEVTAEHSGKDTT